MPSAYLTGSRGPVLTPTPDPVGSPGNGNRSTWRIPTGPEYLLGSVRCTIAGAAATQAQIAAQIAYIRVYADSELKHEMSGAEAAGLADFYRAGCIQNGIIPLRFHRPWMEAMENQDGPGFGTTDLDSLTLEIQWAAASVTIDKAQLYTLAQDGAPLGAHICVQRQTYNYAGTGDQIILDLPRNPQWSLYALHIVGPSANLNELELTCDGSREQFGPLGVIHARLLEATSPRKVQTGWVHLDFCSRNRHADRLRLTMQDLRLRLNWTTAPGSFAIVTEQFRVQPPKGNAAA